MKALVALVFAAVALTSQNSFGTVELTGGGWVYGTPALETIKKIGIASDETGMVRVVLNLANDRQVKLSEGHIQLGLSLLPYQGKCIQIIPGYMFKSVNLILTCD